jgi:hypothetical protein
LGIRAPPHNKKWCMSERKCWTLHWFCPVFLTYLLLWVSSRHFQNSPSGPCLGDKCNAIHWWNLDDRTQKRWGNYWVLLT